MYSPQAFFGGVSLVTATRGVNDPQVGDVWRNGDEDYIFVYNAGNSQISTGQCATISGVTGYSVTVSTVTGADLIVGVCHHATLTTGTYGWLARKGFVRVKMGASDSCVTGQVLTVGVDGTWALKSQATGYVGNVNAKSVESIASAASGYAYVSIF